MPGPRTPFTHLTAGLRMLRNPYEGLLDIYERYGPVSAIGHGPLRYVYMLGREANEFILSTHHDLFEWREAFKALIPVDGDTALVVSDGADHARRRKLVQPAFGRRQIDGYLPVIAEEAERAASRLRQQHHVDLHVEFKQAIRRIAIRTLFGDTLGERADAIGAGLQTAIDYANLPPFLIWNKDLPFTPYRKAMRATRVVDEIVFDEIARRRAEPVRQTDLLAALLDAAEDTDVLTDKEVRDQVVSLIAGGYETTAALAAWTAYAVLSDPTVDDALRDELRSLPSGTITNDGMAACRYLDAVINETLRLYGPAPFSARYAPAAFEFLGYTIPARSTIIYSGYVTHRLPEYWSDPFVFDPTRWLDSEPPPPHVFVPFGGVYRRCIGFALATLETKVLIAELFRTTQLELRSHRPRPTGYATMYPKGGVQVGVG
ncbi:MAG: cytochrome P450 [Acidimicrobiales bacterium]